MFYIKLQGQHFLLKGLSVSDEDIVKICDTVKKSDLFSACHTGPMRTAYSRAQCLKEIFKYLAPKWVFLGRDENRAERFAHYVPVLNTLKNMLGSDFLAGVHVSRS